MGLAAFAFVLIGDMTVSIVPQKMAQAMNSFPLIAAPLFILMGNLLGAAKLTDRIVAFATLMAPDVLRIEAAIDLMRQLPDAPPGTMDFLFANMMLFCQSQGYQRFGLGMAPMSGMEQHQLASRWHRFGRMMFQHGERFYNFRGLRSFKDKFDPEWEARYMIAQGGLAPVFTFSDVAALINGGLKGAISK